MGIACEEEKEPDQEKKKKGEEKGKECYYWIRTRSRFVQDSERTICIDHEHTVLFPKVGSRRTRSTILYKKKKESEADHVHINITKEK